MTLNTIGTEMLSQWYTMRCKVRLLENFELVVWDENMVPVIHSLLFIVGAPPSPPHPTISILSFLYRPGMAGEETPSDEDGMA